MRCNGTGKPATSSHATVANHPQCVIVVLMSNGFDVKRFGDLEKRYIKSKALLLLL